MKHTSLIRLGGLTPIVGGVLYTVASLLGDQFRYGYGDWLARIFKVSFVLFLLSMMVVIVALHLLQRERYGRKGTLASPSAVVGVVGVALM